MDNTKYYLLNDWDVRNLVAKIVEVEGNGIHYIHHNGAWIADNVLINSCINWQVNSHVGRSMDSIALITKAEAILRTELQFSPLIIDDLYHGRLSLKSRKTDSFITHFKPNERTFLLKNGEFLDGTVREHHEGIHKVLWTGEDFSQLLSKGETLWLSKSRIFYNKSHLDMMFAFYDNTKKSSTQ